MNQDFQYTTLNIFFLEQDPKQITSVKKISDLQHETLRFSFKDSFERLGAEVTALNIPPDIIILGAGLSFSDAVTVLTQIKNDENIKLIPVIMLTYEDNPSVKRAVHKIGASRVLKINDDIDFLQEMFRNMKAFWKDIAILPPIL